MVVFFISNNVHFHPFEYSTGITIGVVFVVGTVVGFLIFYKTRTKAPKDKKTRPNQECKFLCHIIWEKQKDKLSLYQMKLCLYEHIYQICLD